jgi:hypothetical protein
MGYLSAATYNTNTSGAGALVFVLLALAFYIVTALGTYGAYKKAGSYGEPAWSAFVPIYNFIVLLRIAGRPKTWGWFLLMILVPYLGSVAFFVVYIIVANDISKSFGHGGGFTVGLALLGPIFWYILWLGSSTYRGPAAALGGSGGYGAGYSQQPGYPPQQPGYPPQPGYSQQPGYPPAGQPPPPMPTYPPQQPGYPPQQPGYPPAGQPPPPMPTYPPQPPPAPPGQAPPPPPDEKPPPPPGQMPPPQ